MTPQSSFMIVAPLQASRVGEMRRLLATMNLEPGVLNPQNDLVRFSDFPDLHFARFVVLEDQTSGDIELAYGVRRPTPPIYLVFMGDFDGTYDEFMPDLAQKAGSGLRSIFSLCDGFSPETDMLAWFAAREHRPAAYYCNWVGRTARQIRQEQNLRRALREHIDQQPELLDRPAGEVHRELRKFVQANGDRLRLEPLASMPLGWRIRHVFDWVALTALIVGGIITLPITIIPLLVVAYFLRAREKSDPVIAPPPSDHWAKALTAQEDHDVTNQFSVMGTLKPGLLRQWALAAALALVNLAARTLYAKGRLARVHTIHFARWVYLDNRARLAFASNYDGSLESYMDDFINRVAFGLNVVFSNGVGYPRTDWLLLRGAKNEQAFKYHVRRHQLPTDVWYNGHPGVTAADRQRNSIVRRGIDRESMTEEQARDWVALI